jgi:hypothetical protein
MSQISVMVLRHRHLRNANTFRSSASASEGHLNESTAVDSFRLVQFGASQLYQIGPFHYWTGSLDPIERRRQYVVVGCTGWRFHFGRCQTIRENNKTTLFTNKRSRNPQCPLSCELAVPRLGKQMALLAMGSWERIVDRHVRLAARWTARMSQQPFLDASVMEHVRAARAREVVRHYFPGMHGRHANGTFNVAI